jgi:hypothetical protein
MKAGQNASKLSLSHFSIGSLKRLVNMINETFKWLFGFGFFSSGSLKINSPSDLNFGFLFFLPILGYSISKMINRNEFYFLFLSSIFSLIAGHIFYEYQGGRFGERFFFEITWMLVLFFVLIAHEILIKIRKSPYWILLIMLPSLLFYIPGTILFFRDSNIHRMDLFLKTESMDNAVIHVGTVPSFDPTFYTRNDPELKGVIYVAMNERLIWEVMEKFPTRDHYLYNYNPLDSSNGLVQIKK